MTTLGKTKDGTNFKIDLDRLVETRLLIQANSGGGKSHTIRKLLEETHGKVQQIVLDMEGEFATLREKYDYILAGKEGDIPVDPRIAETMARKLLELNASAIIDLYELKHHDRIKFVKLFLDAMINADKELWHPVLVVVDEAHVFAPEKGQAESFDALISLATRGRKRGYCAVLATQRLSKLHKDAAAECNNKLIGRTGLDVDMKRASEELGFNSKDDMRSLRDLEPGEFYAFGPAIGKAIEKVRIGEVKTSHPKSGQKIGTITPAPTSKIKEMLSKLTDLPKVAEKELNDKVSLQRRVRELEVEVRKRPAPQVDTQSLEKAEARGYERGMRESLGKSQQTIKALEMALKTVSHKLSQIGKIVDIEIKVPQIEIPKVEKPLVTKNNLKLPAKDSAFIKCPKCGATNHDERYHNLLERSSVETDKTFGKCERAILKFLAMREGKSFNKPQIGGLTGYSPKSGGFKNALSTLKTAGLIVQTGDRYALNPKAASEAIEILGDEYHAPTQESLEQWLNKLGQCSRKIFEILKDNTDTAYTREELAEQTGYSAESGGFKNSISELCSLGLAQRTDNRIQLNQELLGV